MDKFQFFITSILVVSATIGLVTEAIKKILDELNKTYLSNILAGIVALIVSSAACVGYILYTGGAFTTPVIVEIIAFIFMSWLCAMVGYDKVVQTISQFKTNAKD